MVGCVLPMIHRARLIWRVPKTLDLSAFDEDAKAVEGSVGREMLSPAMMLTLWAYAISIGVGSAREIARRTKSDNAVRSIVGDKEVGHSALYAFLVGYQKALDRLMTDVLGALIHKACCLLNACRKMARGSALAHRHHRFTVRRPF